MCRFAVAPWGDVIWGTRWAVAASGAGRDLGRVAPGRPEFQDRHA